MLLAFVAAERLQLRFHGNIHIAANPPECADLVLQRLFQVAVDTTRLCP